MQIKGQKPHVHLNRHRKISQSPFIIKPLSKLRTVRTFLYQIRSLSQLPLTNLTLTGEILEGMFLKSESRQACLSSLFVRQLEDLANAVRQEKERKGVRIRQEHKAISDYISYSSTQNTQETPEENYCNFLAR